ncbi:MAG: DUF1846 domain-containing protein [Chitinispirillales bacterium]|jgi:uncharacterized protein (UPF0371 family)|nr:DUF1846 domain-containing protein [Chitinispirillales bacterium]
MMTKAIGFDNELYLERQTAAIAQRVNQFQNKLYLEFGGKLLFDYHASRVLPGYDPNVKVRLLQQLKENAEVILCIYAGDIERKKIRADFGITYDSDALKMIDDLGERGIKVSAVVITRYENQAASRAFKSRLEHRGISVYTHGCTKGYPTDVDVIVSQEGYGANAYIPTTRPIVVVTGPGPGSGKLATCLSQLYHDYKRGIQSDYAKFETFPVWNLPLSHEVNLAYESATAELKDSNKIDHYHLDIYNEAAVSYNRDIDAFPLLKRILEKITGRGSVYRSPTEMGVNQAAFGIVNDTVVREAARQEILRRYFRCACEYAMGLIEKDALHRVEHLIQDLGIKPEGRCVVLPAREAAERAKRKGKGNDGVFSGASIALGNGEVVTGCNSPLMHAASSMVLNAVKVLAGIPDEIPLLPGNIIESIGKLKKEILLNGKNVSLNLEETLIALGISATANPMAEVALKKLKELRNCEVHTTHIPTPGDEAGLRKLGVNLTSDADFSAKSLFIS